MTLPLVVVLALTRKPAYQDTQHDQQTVPRFEAYQTGEQENHDQ